MKFIIGIIESVASFLLFTSWVAGIALHLYTILVAYQVSGFFSAFLALIFPVFAELYWLAKSWWTSGEFVNGYSIYVMAFVVYLLAGFGLMFLSASLSENRK